MTCQPQSLADIAAAVRALIDTVRVEGGLMRIARAQAVVRRAGGLETLLAVEAALRESGLAGELCELVWSCERGGAGEEVEIRLYDAGRRPLVERAFMVAAA